MSRRDLVYYKRASNKSAHAPMFAEGFASLVRAMDSVR